MADKLAYLLKDLFPDYRNPNLLFANVWVIKDSETHIGEKLAHPWVMLCIDHPPCGKDYRTSLVSSEHRNKYDVRIPAGTFAGQNLRRIDCYVRITKQMDLASQTIEEGDHVSDLPVGIKNEILGNTKRRWLVRGEIPVQGQSKDALP